MEITPKKKNDAMTYADLLMAIGSILIVFFVAVGNLMIFSGDYVRMVIYTVIELLLFFGLLSITVYAKKQRGFTTFFRCVEFGALATFIAVGAWLIYKPISKGMLVMTHKQDLVQAVKADKDALQKSINNFYETGNTGIGEMVRSIRNARVSPSFMIDESDAERAKNVLKMSQGNRYSTEYLGQRADEIKSLKTQSLKDCDFSVVMADMDAYIRDVENGWFFSYPSIDGNLKKLARDLASAQNDKIKDLKLFRLEYNNSQNTASIADIVPVFEASFTSSTFGSALKQSNGFETSAVVVGAIAILLVMAVYVATPRTKFFKNKKVSNLGGIRL